MKNESITVSYCINVPKDATNGDVIMAMFPDAEIFVLADGTKSVKHKGYMPHGCWVHYEAEWWNAPYKGRKLRIW